MSFLSYCIFIFFLNHSLFSLLTGSLALFSDNDFVRIMQSVSVIRLNLSLGSDVCGNLSYLLLGDTGHDDGVGVGASNGNAFGRYELYRMRVSEAHGQLVSADGSFVTDAGDNQSFAERGNYALDHVCDEHSVKTVHGLGFF